MESFPIRATSTVGFKLFAQLGLQLLGDHFQRLRLPLDCLREAAAFGLCGSQRGERRGIFPLRQFARTTCLRAGLLPVTIRVFGSRWS